MAFTRSLALAGAFIIAAGAASAASLLDLTSAGAQKTGTLAGTGYAITAVGGSLNNSQSYDGGAKPTGAIADLLAFQRDGYGVKDDEVTYPGERIVVTFDQAVRLTGVAFLDLFRKSNGHPGEFVALTVDGAAPTIFNSVCPYQTCGGYVEFGALDLVGKVFSFAAGHRNDGVGRPDFALAAIQVAAVPVPAAGLLLLGALGGLRAARRRMA